MKKNINVFINNKIINLLAVIIWMAVIFYLSSQPVDKSNNLSTKVTEVVIDTAGKLAPSVELNPKRANHVLRKNAHFFAYMVLGILVINLLIEGRRTTFKSILLSITICVIYAISDEIHQLFVPGRGTQIKDVIIDTAGSITGILIPYLSTIQKPDIL